MEFSPLSVILLLTAVILGGQTQSESPKAVVTIKPDKQVFRGETVTLTCDIQGGGGDTEWRYSWYKNDYTHRTGQEISFSSVTDSDRGKYTCRGERKSDSQTSETSDAVTLTVSEKPKPELTSSLKGAALTGNSVTLNCELDQSAAWRFYWNKHTQNPENETITVTQSYTISSVSLSDGGQYRCRAGRGDPVYYTHYSDELWINVTDKPKAVVTIKPDKQVFSGETVTLSCDIQGGGDTEWTYSWYKNDYTRYPHRTTQQISFRSVRESDSSNYTCRGERRDSQTSEISDAVTLTVSDSVVLRVSPQSWLTEGDSVTLSCEVRDSSTGWTFSWYRDNKELRGTGGSYTLSPATLHHTGVYVCRAERGEPAYHTQYSRPQPLWITGVSPSVSLIVSPSRCQHFTYDSLSLSCDGQSDSTGWRVRRYSVTEKVSDCSSGWGSVTGSSCDISSLSTYYTGVYWCESESGVRSNPVNISVHYGVILDSPVHPVTEGDSLTLHCSSRFTSYLTAKFYKDGLFLQTTRKMIIHSVSQSDEGLYHCKHQEEGESAQSWISVRRSLSGFLTAGVAVGLSFVLLLIVLSVFLCYNKKKGTRSPPTGHQNTSLISDQNQNPGLVPLQNVQTDEDQSQYAVTEE